MFQCFVPRASRSQSPPQGRSAGMGANGASHRALSHLLDSHDDEPVEMIAAPIAEEDLESTSAYGNHH